VKFQFFLLFSQNINYYILKIVGRLKNEFKSLIKLGFNINIWLLIPITIFTGYELTYIWFEFNRVIEFLNFVLIFLT
jgi:hypothetical protein